MKILYKIFTIQLLILINAFCYEATEDDKGLMELEDVDSFIFSYDSKGTIKSVKVIKYKTSLEFSNDISFSYLKTIPTWNSEKLQELIPDIPLPKTGIEIKKITYSSRLDLWRKTNRKLASLFVSGSSFYYDNNSDKPVLDKYGASFATRITRKKYFPRFAGYAGFEYARISSFYGYDNGDDVFLNSEQRRFFSVFNFQKNDFFLKIEPGFNMLHYANDATLDVFFKFPIENKLYGFMQVNIEVDRKFLKHKKNFEGYGSVNSKIGVISDISPNFSISMFISYEKNKRFGFEVQEMGFSAKYKMKDIKMPKLNF